MSRPSSQPFRRPLKTTSPAESMGRSRVAVAGRRLSRESSGYPVAGR